MVKKQQVQSQQISQPTSKKKDPLRPANLLQSALEKKTPVDIKLISGEIIKDAIILYIEVYEIAIMHNGNIEVLWKHAMQSVTLKPK